MAEQSTLTLDAQIVRRFLAKAYGEDHPAMEAMGRMYHEMQWCLARERIRGCVPAFMAIDHGRHPDVTLYLPHKTAEAPNTLHGDFGAMELTRKQDHESCSHWGLVYSD